MSLLFALIAQLSTPQSTIQGTVRAAGSLEPIPYATVSVPELPRTVRADQKGYFVVPSVPRGQWRIEASAPGYASHAVTIESGGDRVIQLDIELDVRPIELDPVEVEAQPEATSRAPSMPDVAGPPSVRLDGPTLKLVPGLVEADVLRSLQMLPAVAAMSDFSTGLYVRGGSAEQNLITLDGVPLFNPYHVGGIFSAIGADAVSSVDLWAGAFPARGGDRLSSLVQIQTRDGGRDEIRTSGSVGLLSAHTTIDGPLPGGRGGFLFSGRHTYLDVMSIPAHAVGLIPFTIPYGFSDAYLKLTHSTGKLGSLTISGYLDGESLRPKGQLREDFAEFDMAWGSRMLSAAWRQPIAGNLLLEARVGYSGFYGDFDLTELRDGASVCDPDGCRPIMPTDTTPLLEGRTRMHDLLAAVDMSWFRRAHVIRAGVQLDGYLFDHVLEVVDEDNDLIEPFESVDRPRTLAAYVEDEWSPSERLTLRAGLRMLEAGGLGRAWLPRLGARWQVGTSLALSAGAGRYAQAMRTLRNDESLASSFIAYDLLAAQPAEVGLAESEDIVLGVEWRTPSTRIRADMYARRMTNLIVPHESEDPLDAPLVITDRYSVASGSTRGVEIMASRQFGAAELGLSYALTSAERRAGDDVFAPRFERRHMMDANATIPLGRSGMLSTRLSLGTGQPYTPVIGVTPVLTYDPVTRRWTSGSPVAIRGEHNAARLPGYLRLDVAARKSYDKRWFGQPGTLTPYIQVLNVLNTRNVLIADPSAPEGELEYLPQLPFLPTFGVEWRF
ncbi:MAG: TonB-dependent receptor [Longimicrobiales bacterium]